MHEVNVYYKGEMTFEAAAKDKKITIGVPKEFGGLDNGMNPSEAFISSIGACIGLFIARYCKNASLDSGGLSIRLNWNYSKDRSFIEDIDIRIRLPNADLGKRRQAVMNAAKLCTLHNTIAGSPKFNFSLEESQG